MVFDYKTDLDTRGHCDYCEEAEWDEKNRCLIWCPHQKMNVPVYGTCDKYKGI